MSKTIKKSELSTMSLDQLADSLISCKKFLFKIRFNAIITKDKDTSLIKKNKKSIARIKTRINHLKAKLNI